MATTRKRTAAIPNKDVSSNGHISKQNSATNDTQIFQQNDPTPSPTAIAKTILSPTVLTPFAFIFGGCCSNVYILESILSFSPTLGPLITFLQFLFTALFTLPSQLTTKTPPKTRNSSWVDHLPRLRERDVPLRKWFIYTAMFLVVNMLNNLAFRYKISLPLHIILRSASPVTSMLVGYVWAGRRYTPRKIFAVMLLFTGVVIAALSDAASKGEVEFSDAPTTSALSQQLPGFTFILVALIISACLGVYTDKVYEQHGRTGQITNENLFYSHALPLPYFVSQYKSLADQFSVLISNASAMSLKTPYLQSKTSNLPKFLELFSSYIPIDHINNLDLPLVPIILLIANGVTQIMCISGVNQLATETTSLTVSVTLNIRKLVSLLLSIWLFGNTLSLGVSVGALLVFLGGGLYSIPERKIEKGNKKQ